MIMQANKTKLQFKSEKIINRLMKNGIQYNNIIDAPFVTDWPWALNYSCYNRMHISSITWIYEFMKSKSVRTFVREKGRDALYILNPDQLAHSSEKGTFFNKWFFRVVG